MTPRNYGSATVLECELCGALAGDPASIRRAQDARRAEAAGIDAALYPLVRVLSTFPGLVVRDCGMRRDGEDMPFVEINLSGPAGLLQVENVAKSLRLQPPGLPWTISVEYRDALAFVLTVLPGASSNEGVAAALRRDLEVMPQSLERHSRLSWWRRDSEAR